MSTLSEDCLTGNKVATPAVEQVTQPSAMRGALSPLLAGVLAACGGGGGGGGAAGTGLPPPAVKETITPERAARFLAQASMGASREQIAMVQSLGYAGWIDEQMALPQSRSRWDWLVDQGLDAAPNLDSEVGADSCQWHKLFASHDTLRQRVTLALSEILVITIGGVALGHWGTFSAAYHLDLLESHAFGNYRTLLEQVSLSMPMGIFLTYCGNAKADPANGTRPDENYARELMQLFTIGLVRLKPDGSVVKQNGVPVSTYTEADVKGLARVMTGWDSASTSLASPDRNRQQLVQLAGSHETGSKTFLGHTINAGTSGAASLTQALDVLFAHPNVAPFISAQLIQRLVCSNPSPAYVGRVAAVFDNDGTGVKGNLAAVVRAILLDREARASVDTTPGSFGKQREPILRLVAWGRAFGASSPDNAWAIGNLTDPVHGLGQSPLRAVSVFNFFQPHYVPANSAIARAGLVAPEFQITNETTVLGYLNFMQRVITGAVSAVRADYTALLPLADDASALLAEINLLLACGQIGPDAIAIMRAGLDPMAAGSESARQDRIHAAIFMVMAGPEFIVQK